MARYAITRERTMRGLGHILARSTMNGMGTTYSFVPRPRGMRGLGQIDPVSGLPCSDPAANCPPDIGPSPIVTTPPFMGPLPTPAPPPQPTTTIPAPTTLGPPPGFFTFPSPILPPQKITPVTPPVITPTFPSTAPGISIIFPSGGGTALPLAAPAGWLDQSTGGFPNKYLALFAVGAVLAMSVSAGRRR